MYCPPLILMAVHSNYHYVLRALFMPLIFLSRFARAGDFNQFLYPLLNASPPNVQVGDIINVSWVSDWLAPTLIVCCGDATNIQRDLVQTVPQVNGTGSSVFFVSSYWVKSCVFELVHTESANVTYFNSGEISMVNEERSPRTWGDSIQLLNPPSPTSAFTDTKSSGTSSRSSGTSSGAPSVAILVMQPSPTTSSTSSLIAASTSLASVPGTFIPTAVLTTQAPSITTSPTSNIGPSVSITSSSSSVGFPSQAPADYTILQKVAMALAISMGVLLALLIAGLGWYIPHRRARKLAEKEKVPCGAVVRDPWWYDHPHTPRTERIPSASEVNGGRYELDGTPRTETEGCAFPKVKLAQGSLSSHRSQAAWGLGLEGT